MVCGLTALGLAPFLDGILAAMPTKPKDPEPNPSREDSERSRFARFAKKLVNVPKREIDEKAKEWKGWKERKQA